MKEKLEQIGLIRKSTKQLDFPKSTFLNFLSEITGETEEVKIFGKPNYQYYGMISQTNFEITENQRPFGKTSGANLICEITETKEGIELRIESLLLAKREYILRVSESLCFLLE